MKQLRGDREAFLLFDTGNCLAGRPLVDISKGKAMTAAMGVMGYDAMALGSIDFLNGWDAVEGLMDSTSFPFLSADIVTRDREPENLFAKPYIILERTGGGITGKIAVMGLSDPVEFSKLPHAKTGALYVVDPIESAAPFMKEILQETRRIIVLSNLKREQEIEFARKYPETDIIVSARSPGMTIKPYYVKGEEVLDLAEKGENLHDGTLIVSCIPKGQGVSVLDVTLTSGGDIESYDYQLLGVTLDTEEDTELVSLLRSYENTMAKPDAAQALEEYRELIKGDFSYLGNLSAIEEIGTRGLEAFDRGEYKEALDLLRNVKDRLLIRETAMEKRRILEEDLARGIPQGMPTDELYTEFEKAKSLFREGRFSMAQEKFVYTNWLLTRIRTTAEKYETYKMNKDILEKDGISLTLDDQTSENLERALREERYRDALVILRKANMKIDQGRDAQKWRLLTNKLRETAGDAARGNQTIDDLMREADSLYYAGAFLPMKQRSYRAVNLLEPLAEGKGILAEADGETSEGNRYVGSQECRQCHEAEYDHWNTTLHATAYTSMDEESRNDPDCAVCHVVGLGSSDGFEVGKEAPGLAAVGCESCHGRGQLHTLDHETSPMLSGYERENCRTCHNPGKGFDFDFFPMLVKIMHDQK